MGTEQKREINSLRKERARLLELLSRYRGRCRKRPWPCDCEDCRAVDALLAPPTPPDGGRPT